MTEATQKTAPRKKWFEFIEMLKNLVEICALVIAGWWTFYYFQRTDGPSLENAISFRQKIEIDSLNKETCILKYEVLTHNLSRSAIDIDSVLVQSWLIPLDSFLKCGTFACEYYMQIMPPMKSSIDHEIVHYAPNQQHSTELNFFVPFRPNSVAICKYVAYWHKSHWFKENEVFSEAAYYSRIRCIPDKIKNGTSLEEGNED